MDYRKSFVVEPGSKVRLKAIDPAFPGKHADEASARPTSPRSSCRADRAAVPALRREEARAPRRAPGHRRRRQGRHCLARDVSAMNPQGTTVTGFKQPTGRGGGPRLPLAGASARPGSRPGRRLQPLALRGRAGGARARPGAEGGLVEALRPDQRLREAARRHRHHHRQVLPLHLARGAARALQGPPRRPVAGSGRSATPTTRSAPSGTTTPGPTRRCSSAARPGTRRGT